MADSPATRRLLPDPTLRIRFRDMREDDLDAMADLLGDPAVMAFYPAPLSRDEAHAWIANQRRRYEEHGLGLWVIESLEGEFLGDCGVTWQSYNGIAVREVGYHVRPDRQREGLATEAALACLDLVRREFPSTTLTAIIHPDNTASRRVAEKLGMTRIADDHAHPWIVRTVMGMTVFPPAGAPLQVSTAKVDITPPAGYPLAGYATEAEPRRAEGTNAPLLARCTVLWDDGVPKAVVTADVLAFGRTIHRRIRDRVVELGIASADFVLNAGHTHNGPVLIERLEPYVTYALTDLREVEEYSDRLVTRIVALVRDALGAARTTCTLDCRVSEADFAFNRVGLAHAERDVPVLVARALDGAPRAVLFSYGAHPVAGGRGALFDPDYPGAAVDEIEATHPGCFAQFVLGPAGDQNPVKTDGYARSAAYGRSLGRAIAAEIRTPGRLLKTPISTVLTEVDLPLDVVDAPGARAMLRAAFLAREASGVTAYERRHGETMARLVDDASEPLETTIPLPVQRWRIDGAPGLSMIFSGGEVVSGYAERLRAEHGGTERLWFTAYANEVPGYIPSDEILARPCYEAGYRADHPDIAAESMAAYGHLAHFLTRLPGTSTRGVEQVYGDAVQALL
ncbi:GNAT family N-acetyltransferase [Microbacterium capsulatum]|uniref:GNAT family N-acetyltransferase n=1 Tax=Microbacterium capsulatum TaxID=3041921 RepID=A0ABU0XBW0_9MICO|nr:GNAT family N-acetyltransferase [Microbacterium sp. ASV81]MDQ4212596.1 GNAT family N-acetyltransferase [Microbacterium sp. ASV81]